MRFDPKKPPIIAHSGVSRATRCLKVVIPLFHTGHESPESTRIDFFLFGGIREVSLIFFLQS